MLHRLGEQARQGASGGREPWPSLAAPLALALAMGCAYFLAARLGLALLTEAEGVAVFWPASGVAAGTLIALGPRAWLPVAVGVVAATAAANLLGDRSLATALTFGLCNAGEAVLTAWLIGRWAARPFKLDSLQRVFLFLAAACLGAAVAAVAAALAMNLLHARVPLLNVWRVWAAADGLGIVTIAPLLIGLNHLASERVPQRELIEGAGALALLGALSAVVYAAPPGSWAAYVPPAALFPVLLWVTGRCGPAFAAAAALIVCSALVYATIFGSGSLGDPAAPLAIRVPGAQVSMLVTVLCVLVLSALFAERRRNEAQLRESNERLRLALGGAELGVWSVDLETGAFESDARDCQVNGHDPAAPPRTLAEARATVHPQDLPRLDAAFAAARQTGTPCRTEYRLRTADAADPARPRWVAVEGTVVRNAPGRPPRLLGVTRDITERKQAEEHKNLLLAELDHRVKNVLAVVAAVASRTLEASSSMADFAAALDGRIQSMAGTHELLSGRKWQGIPLAELVERELAPHFNGHNVRIEGPEVVLRAEVGQALAMVLHELATNAAKYGALSAQNGSVSVRWRRVAENGSGGVLALDWLEAGGPAVALSPRAGYGTSIIRDLIPYEFGGTVDLELAAEGARCRLRIPGPGRAGAPSGR